MPFFSDPVWLLPALPAIYLLWRIKGSSFVPGSPAKHNFWFVFRCLILTLVFFALAGFQFSRQVRRNQILFLIDASDSIAPEQKERALQFVNKAVHSIKAPDEVGIIVFGTNAEVERFPGRVYPASAIESKIDGSGTNLENAFRLADAVLAESYQKNIVLLSDGQENLGHAQNTVNLFRKKGGSLQAHYLQPVDRVEAQVESVRVPSEIRLKEPFTIDVVAAGNRSMPALIQIFQNGSLIQEGTIVLDGSKKSVLRIPQKILAPGIYRYEVRIKPEQDFQIENNSQQAWISVSGPPRILLVDEKPEDLSALAEALQNRGFSVDLKEGRYFPLSLEELLLYQAVFIRNVPSNRIHDRMPMIKQYVHEFGGGFAMLGGEKSFGPGGYYQTPVESTLPVRMDLVNKKYLADVAMVIVIDKSGSMSFTDRGRQKIDLADEGGARVASLLKESDRLGVLAVDSVPKWAFPVQRLGNKNDAIEAITSIRAGGGGIYVYSGLREAYQALREIKASVKHVILFADTADCEEKEGPSGDSSLNLAARALEDSQITTTTIGIGQNGDPDVEFLQHLATISEGRFYFTNDMFTLPEIFAQESSIVQRYYITEETFQPKIMETEPLLTGITAIPPLNGYVATTAKPHAGMALSSHRDDPVLAFWRYGLGQSIAYTSDAGGPWSGAWLQWNEWERFWAQAGRYVARVNRPARFQSSFDATGNSTKVIVDTFDEPQEDDSVPAGAVVDSSGNEHQLQFARTSYGRYEAEVDARGPLFGKIFRLKDQDIEEEGIIHFAGTVNREYLVSGAGREFLKQIAGRIVESPGQLEFSGKTATDVQPLRREILLWAVLLFVFDIAARKLEPALLKRHRPADQPDIAVSTALGHLKSRKTEMEKQRPTWIEMETKQTANDWSVQPTSGVSPAEEKQAEQSEYMQRLKEAKKRK